MGVSLQKCRFRNPSHGNVGKMMTNNGGSFCGTLFFDKPKWVQINAGTRSKKTGWLNWTLYFNSQNVWD
jgi:hypothetical protein